MNPVSTDALVELHGLDGWPSVPLLERAAFEASSVLASAALALRRWRRRQILVGFFAFLVLPFALVAVASLPEWFVGVAFVWTIQGFWYTFRTVVSSPTGVMAKLVAEKESQLSDLKLRLTRIRLGAEPPLTEYECRSLRGDLLAAFETGILATQRGA